MAFLGIPIVLSVMAFMVSVVMIWAITKFVLYIFQSFGLLNIAKKENNRYPYIAWIPGLSHYILGKFCYNHKEAILYSILNIIKIVLFSSIILISNKVLFYTFIIYNILYFIIDMLVMNRFYQKVYYHQQIFTIFTIITFGLLKPIFIYTVKIKKIAKYEI